MAVGGNGPSLLMVTEEYEVTGVCRQDAKGEGEETAVAEMRQRSSAVKGDQPKMESGRSGTTSTECQGSPLYFLFSLGEPLSADHILTLTESRRNDTFLFSTLIRSRCDSFDRRWIPKAMQEMLQISSTIAAVAVRIIFEAKLTHPTGINIVYHNVVSS